jgi:hypothetical protein
MLFILKVNHQVAKVEVAFGPVETPNAQCAVKVVFSLNFLEDEVINNGTR